MKFKNVWKVFSGITKEIYDVFVSRAIPTGLGLQHSVKRACAPLCWHAVQCFRFKPRSGKWCHFYCTECPQKSVPSLQIDITSLKSTVFKIYLYYSTEKTVLTVFCTFLKPFSLKQCRISTERCWVKTTKKLFVWELS